MSRRAFHSRRRLPPWHDTTILILSWLCICLIRKSRFRLSCIPHSHGINLSYIYKISTHCPNVTCAVPQVSRTCYASARLAACLSACHTLVATQSLGLRGTPVATASNETGVGKIGEKRYKSETIDKNLSCRRETARRFVSLNILLSHLRSLKIIRNDIVT